MNKKNSKEERALIEKEKEKYPVQKIGVKHKKVSKEELDEAVREINPDEGTLDRG